MKKIKDKRYKLRVTSYGLRVGKCKNRAVGFLILLFLLSLIQGCPTHSKDEPISGTRTYIDFVDTGKRFGVEAGDVYGDLARDFFVARSVKENINIADLLDPLKRKRIDAILVGSDYLTQLLDSGIYNEFEYLWLPESVFVKKSSFIFHSESLRDQYNEWFQGIKSDGTFQTILDRWLGGSLPNHSDIPVFEFSDENGILRIADTGNYPPLSYLDAQGNLIGFGAELASHFAQHLGMKPEFSLMPYENIISNVVSERNDMSSATMSISDSRNNELFFGDPSNITRAVLIVPRGRKLGVDIYDFVGQRLAILTSSHAKNVVQEIKGFPVSYDSISDAVDSVLRSQILGFMSPFSVLRSISMLEGGGLLDVIAVPVEIDYTAVGAMSMNQDIIDSFNDFLEMITNDGTLHSLQNRWFISNVDYNHKIDYFLDNPPNMQGANLRVVVNAEAIPYVFINTDGNFSGYSAELALRFGDYIGRNIDFINAPFGEVINIVEQGLADFSIDKFGITEERQQRVLFTNPIYSERNGILFLRQLDDSREEIDDYRKFINKRIGMSIGSLAEGVTINHLKGVPVFFTYYSASIADLRAGRIDGHMSDLSTLNALAAMPENHDLHVYEIPSSIFSSPIGAFSNDQALIDRFNAFLTELERLGMLREIQNRWFSTPINLDSRLHSLSNVGANGVLRVATSDGSPPYSFVGNDGEMQGYSIELIRLFANHEGLMIRFAEMNFDALLTYVSTGRADIGISNVSISEGRRQIVNFSNPIYFDRFGILALKTETQLENQPLVLTDFFGKRIGVTFGTNFDSITTNVIQGIPVYYNDFNSALTDIIAGRLNGYMLNYTVASMLETVASSSFEIIELMPTEMFITQVAAISKNKDLLDRFNLFLENITTDGTLNEIQRTWMFSMPKPDIRLTESSSRGENGVLRVVTSGATLPFSFYNEDNEPVGFSLEIAKRFADHENMSIDFVHTNLSRIFRYIEDDNADMGFDLFQIPEEQTSNILYSDPFFLCNASIVAFRDAPDQNVNYFSKACSWIQTGIQKNLITDNRWRLLLDGFKITMFITILAQIFGTILGSFICFLMVKKNKFLRTIGNLYHEIICRIPKVVLLLVAYYILFNKTSLSNVMIAVFAFTMIASSNIARVFRNSFYNINVMEKEAAKTLGFTNIQTFIYITLPQLIQQSIVAYTKDFIELLKTTAIVGYIAIQDLTRAGEIIRSRTFDAFFPLLVVTLIYMLVITISIFIFKILAMKINKNLPFYDKSLHVNALDKLTGGIS
ncbi:MAG: ABC transporter permease subunit [Candidatus Cloacimonetes bacterium]|nr:ABC transporter permease subunit [Candidatus Cloacimonadota bacterium]